MTSPIFTPYRRRPASRPWTPSAAFSPRQLLPALWIGAALLLLIAQDRIRADDGSSAWKQAVDEAWTAYERAQQSRKAWEDPAGFVEGYVRSNYKDAILGPEISADMHALFQAFFGGVDGLRGTGRGDCWEAAYNDAWTQAFDLSHEGIIDGFARVWFDLIEKLSGGSAAAVQWATDYLNGKNSKDEIIRRIRDFFKDRKPETYQHSWTDSHGCEIAVAATLDRAKERYEVVLTGYCRCRRLPVFLTNRTYPVNYWTIVSRGTLKVDPLAPYGILFSPPITFFNPNCDCVGGVTPARPRGGGSAVGPGGRPGRGPEPVDFEPLDCEKIDCAGLVVLIDKTERYLDELIRQRDQLPEGNHRDSTQAYIDTVSRLQQSFLEQYYQCCQRSLDGTPPSTIPDGFKQALLNYNSYANRYTPGGGGSDSGEGTEEGDEGDQSQPQSGTEDDSGAGSSSDGSGTSRVCPPCDDLAREVERRAHEAARLSAEARELASEIRKKRRKRDGLEKEVAELERWLSENAEFQAVLLDENGQPVRQAGETPKTRAKRRKLEARQQQVGDLQGLIDAEFDAWRARRREEDAAREQLDAARRALDACTESRCGPGTGDGALEDGSSAPPAGPPTSADERADGVDTRTPTGSPAPAGTRTPGSPSGVAGDVNGDGVFDYNDPVALLHQGVYMETVKGAISLTKALLGEARLPRPDEDSEPTGGADPEPASGGETGGDGAPASSPSSSRETATPPANSDDTGTQALVFSVDVAVDTQTYIQLGPDGPIVAALFGFVEGVDGAPAGALPRPDVIFDGDLRSLIQRMMAGVVCPNVFVCCQDGPLVTDNFAPPPPAPFEASPLVPGSYKEALYTILESHGIAGPLLDGIAAAGGEIKDVQVAPLGTGTKASYNTETDTIRISSTFDLGDGSLRESRGLIASLAHEVFHAYIDQVVKGDHDPDTRKVLQATADWTRDQTLNQEGAAKSYAPGDHPWGVWWYRFDFAEEYASQVANHLVDRHLRIAEQLGSGVGADGTPYDLDRARAEWNGVVESTKTTSRFPAYVGDGETQYEIDAPPPGELVDKIIELMDLGFDNR